MPKIEWDKTCCKCIYGSLDNKRTNAKGKCTHKHPDIQYVIDEGWICNSFVRRWETKEDLIKSREEAGHSN